jgi:hypothetical protein
MGVVVVYHVDLPSLCGRVGRGGDRLRRSTRPPTGNGHPIWLFAGSKAGGERAAAIYTVVETCKLNGVEPQAYIADVIAKIAGNWPAARWDELMPWNWRPDFQTIAEAA